MDESMKDSLKMISFMDTELIIGQMGVNILDYGKKESKMEQENF